MQKSTIQTPYIPLPVGAIRPDGWLRERLRLMASTITGRLDEVWRDVGPDNGWLGGGGDAWERPVYWLDGLLPLAYILKDETLIAKAQRYVEWMLQSQREDGQFGPPGNQDMWPRMVALKVLLAYHGATGDKRVPPFLLRFFQYADRALDAKPLHDWGRARGGELQLAALMTYRMTGKPFLLDVMRKVGAQTIDWTGMFHAFPYQYMDMSKEQLKTGWTGLDTEGRAVEGDIKDYWMRQYLQTHVVNVAMALKQPAVDAALGGGLKQAQAFREGWDKLMRHHGVAIGLFTGDEHLSGASPSQGTELCAVVEAMYSMETLLWLTGDALCGDILEKLCFGALPAALTADGWGHQYDQQSNQVLVTKAKRDWHSNGDDANLYGLEPNFGCCTANLHQGFPKYAASLWMATEDGGLCAQSYAPCRVTWRVSDTPVRAEVRTRYPLDGAVDITLRLKAPAAFPLHLRIPAWARGARVAVGQERPVPAEPGSYHIIKRTFADGDTVRLELPMQPRVTRWFHQSAAVERGPVLFALHIEEEWRALGEGHLADREARPLSPWNYALLPDHGFIEDIPPDAEFTHGTSARLFATGVPLPEWGMRHNSAAPPPVSPEVDGVNDARTLTLVPYAFTGLRVAQFPVGREG